MRLGVIGGGTVGHATARAFLGHVEEVRVYDVRPERSTHSFDATLKCELVFICLPTPQKEGSLECDVSVVEDFCKAVDGQSVNAVIKSTVPVGTTRRLREQYGLVNLVHSPEFLSARTAALDAQMPARNVIGGTADDMTVGYSESPASALLYDLYESRFPGTPIYRMTSDESEAVKLFQNAFSAVKIAAFNEFHAFASRLGLAWPRVREALLAGGWISPAHTQVPGPDGKFGYGGECLVKDTANLIHCFGEAGLIAHMCYAAQLRNLSDRERTA